MSTIMKALRRLENDKNSHVQRSLREEVVGGTEPRRRSPVLLVGVGVFATGLAIGAGALLFWPGELPIDRDAAEAGAPAEVARSTPEPRAATPTPTSEARPTRQPAPARTPRRSALDRARAQQVAPPAVGRATADAPLGDSGADAARIETVAVGRATAGAPIGDVAAEPEVAVVRRIEPPPLAVADEVAQEPRPPRAGEVRPGAQALRSPPRPRTPRPAPAQVAAVEPTAAPAQPSAPPAVTPPAPQPVEPEPARITRRPEPSPPPPRESVAAAVPPPPSSAGTSTVPVILVSRTHWHPSSERREAEIEVEAGAGPEKRRVREGDRVGPLRVEKIEPSGVVFDYDGVELRHAVGSDPD